MRTFVFGELPSVFKDSKNIGYCYKGARRGSVALLIDDTIMLISPSGYMYSGSEDFIQNDNSNFELWSFINEMIEEEDFEIRQEAVNRFFDVYCNMYPFLRILQEYQFITE